ncbi:hypothetical protein PtA15_11A244 [Puccinia triticina]|uniref:Fe2OG dioxygenase domain-containing protein n=1 Tax=Puccinia triticina TaxID=208348 RepID=A0ABY7CWA8_9BASI|nr:uncharacterized protein PtA15_11A244 [Puccinia triticina]WAQ89554.1 hypothetical protein PtA15_11A244 [Puccinia triticina]WAR59596.1 hypothetical protein PtB15_11B236 [Puccinia triticina]
MGYLLDGCPAPRDVFEDSGKVIISHGTTFKWGRIDDVSAYGITRPSPINTSQIPNKRELSCQSIDQVYGGTRACGFTRKKFSGMPWFQDYPSVRYAVLGYYLVTHYWPEREFRSDEPNEYSVRFKFRFQWVSSQGDPWWVSDMKNYYKSLKPWQSVSVSDELSASSSLGADEKPAQLASGEMDWEATPDGSFSTTYQDMFDVEDEELLKYKCNGCGKESFNIYKGSWMCLNEFCWDFFRTKEQYDFFEWSATASPSDTDMAGLKYVMWFLRHQLSLEDDHRVPFPLTPTTLQNLTGNQIDLASHLEAKVGFYCSACGRLSIRIYWRVLICSNEECQFTVNLTGAPLELPRPADLTRDNRKMTSNRCDITSLDPIGPLKAAGYSLRWYRFHDISGGVIHATPNDLRKADCLFQDFQTALDPWSFKRNQLRFSQEVETRPWLQIPIPIFRAYSGLCKFVRDALNHEVISSSSKKIGLDDLLPETFNEILSCFYLPGTGMNYHSDNELGLGGVIVSLSLGSTAMMRFKRKQPNGPDLKEEPSVKKSNPPILELVVNHGDVVLQCGSELQEKYVHSLHTDGVRISTTMRYINPNLMG